MPIFLRSITPVIKRFATIYPIVGITGPRQSGKTTLAKTLFPHLPYVNLENLDIRIQAQNDPRAFLGLYVAGAIFDEIQHVPELLSYLQQIVDESEQKGRYVVTGSQNFALSEQVSQSLPGRIGMITLLPLSLSELNASDPALSHNISSVIFNGCYPGLYTNNMLPSEFYPSYIQTYLERDVRQIKNIDNLGLFQAFLKLCAGRVGQILNYSSLAQDCDISHSTVERWLTVLEASNLIFRLRPFYQNFSKRLIKMPKLYFYDTGLACSLLGLEQESQLETHYLKGALYENMVILEILKERLNRGMLPNIYFWRDHTGHEVNLIGEWGGSIKAIKIKAGATFQPTFVKNVNYFCTLSPIAKGYLIYMGTQEGVYSKIKLLPLHAINQILEE